MGAMTAPKTVATTFVTIPPPSFFPLPSPCLPRRLRALGGEESAAGLASSADFFSSSAIDITSAERIASRQSGHGYAPPPGRVVGSRVNRFADDNGTPGAGQTKCAPGRTAAGDNPFTPTCRSSGAGDNGARAASAAAGAAGTVALPPDNGASHDAAHPP